MLRYALRRPDVEHPWLFDRCREIQAEPNGFLDLWARDHYKSTIITFALSIQDILSSHGSDPDPKWDGLEACIGIFSHTRPIAKGFLRSIKYEFESNPLLLEWFPDVLWTSPHKEAPKWSEDDGIILRRKNNRKESTVEAWGIVDSQPTGKHFPIRVYDDVVEEKSVGTPEMIKKTTSAWRLSQNLGAAPQIMRHVGTRYSFGDTYGEIMEQGSVRTRIYAITKDGTETGEPWLRSREEVRVKRRDQGPYTFACQQLLDPVGAGAQSFKPEWIQYHGVRDWAGMPKVILVDPANEKKKDSDYTAAWVVAFGEDRKYYVVDIVRDRLDLLGRSDLLFRWHRKYRPDQVLYEQYGLQADIQHFRDRMTRDRYTFPVTPVGGKMAKADRIKRLVPIFERGDMLLPHTLYYTDYEGYVRDLVHDFREQEYKAFPVASHDDLLDALARVVDSTVEFPEPEAFEEETGSIDWMAV